MKKIFALLSVFMITVLFAIAHENKFYEALQTCTPYVDDGNVSTEGMTVKAKEQIVGKENNKCVYKEQLSLSGVEASVVCKFTQSQIDEILAVMKAYSTVQKYSGENVDTSSLNAVQNNPVVNVWNKFLNDGSTCSIETTK